MKSRLCVGVSVACAAAASAYGQLTYVARSSTVGASSTQGPTNTQTAANFNSFNQSVSSNGFRGNSAASQQSSLSSGGVAWTVTSSAFSAFGSPMSGGSGASSVTNTFSVTFDVASTTGFELSGNQIFWPINPVGSNFVRLNRISGVDGAGTVYSRAYPDPDGAYFTSGTLTPGQYTLSIDFSMHAAAGSIWGPYTGTGQLTFTPAPGAAAVMGMAGVLAARRRRR